MQRTRAEPGSVATRSLRFRLFLIAATGLVPLALVLLLSTVWLGQQRSAETRRLALELSRAMATAVEAELQASIALLDSLAQGAQLSALAPDQLEAAFVPMARKTVQRQGWRNVLIADDRGETVARALSPPGANPSGPVEPASMAQVLRARSAVIGRVARGPRGQDAFAVRVPVFQGEKLRYVLSAVVPTDRILAVVARQRLEPAWVTGIFDQDGFRVARSKLNAAPRYSPSLEALVRDRGDEGTGETLTLEGVPSHTGFSRVPLSGWVVAVGIPLADANAEFHRQLTAVVAGSAASLAVMAWLAWRLSGRISGPIDDLRQAATALGAGQPVQLGPLAVQELDTVGQALRQAAHEREQAQQRRVKVQAEREQLLARLEQALHEAEKASRNKDEFLALLGHELRNPLAPITNALHLMQMKGDTATQAERAIIHRQLNYMTRLVDDLLDVSRIASRRMDIHLRALQPVALLEQVMAATQPLLRGRKLRLQADGAVRRAWVRADETRLLQVFNNLLGNAIKFTTESGTIDIHARIAEPMLAFSFHDDGQGMSPEEISRAFDRFYQAPQRQRNVQGGLGLGLAIVKSLVEMHGGTVHADSDGPERGSTITVQFPLAESAPDGQPASTASSPGEGVPVMIVDDNIDAADSLATLLQACGYATRTAYSAQAALDTMVAFTPEVAILDIGLPDMSGYELARRLRSRMPPFTGRLVALTGYGLQQDVRRALDAGFDTHLTKPVAPDALLALIDRLRQPGGSAT